MKNLILYLCLFHLLGCQSWFYKPSSDKFMDPRVLGHNFDDIVLKVPWRDKMHGWIVHSKRKSSRNPSQGTVVYFHDGSKNITHHFSKLAWVTESNLDLYLFDYQGFGQSTGSHNEENLIENITRILNYTHFRKQGKFIIYCHGTAGGPCTQALARWKRQSHVDLLIYDSVYASARENMKHHLSQSWWTYLGKYLVPLFVSDDLAANGVIDKIIAPTLVIHSKQNRKIPFYLGEDFYKKLKSKKMLWNIQRSGHQKTFDNLAKKDYFLDVVFHPQKYLK